MVEIIHNVPLDINNCSNDATQMTEDVNEEKGQPDMCIGSTESITNTLRITTAAMRGGRIDYS